ncbi:universal stress protein UspA [Burkholderia sp. MSMB617WGS]|uniref:Universal stress protein UspA n=1 Tax=Burkholderia savannae TaxID=1637837 RepID=A0ABR5T5G5_9BURK|nr:MULTISPECIES: universal stress protein [Burkholderia]AOJ83516.1 universal stress protein UspA [Burkholderia savannae]AOK50232.1 universal stress protein UspA [Burkholderia sp. MSMB617WGS]KGS08106.1 universal stress family protein [Burkholderia sp. ABCPW 111]KWZ38465.1 universal stress protein UspA [Burkholderia savannae]KWZ47473.1 universal stress protein UspA [Burkholderia savannae]
MYKKIFAALDGSRSASVALDEAIKIAKTFGATVTAVCVVEHKPQLVDVNAAYIEPQEDDNSAADIATRVLADAKGRLAEQHVEGSVRAIDSYGEDVAAVLMRTAAESDADLIVMGTSGRHGIRRLLLGSVAESLLRMADRPVLLRRHDELAS